MKRKALLVPSLAGVLLAAFCAASSADMIEVKGRGVISGKIVREDKNGVTFTDGWGNTETYPHDQVTYVERTKEPIAKKIKKKVAAKDGEKGEGSKPGGISLPFNLPQIEGAEDWATILNRGFTLWSNFWSGDVEQSYEEAVNEIVDRVKNVRKIATGTGPYSQAVCFAGMGVILVGLIGLVLFTWQLVFSAFEEGMFWGFMLIGSGMANFAPLVGGDAGLVLLIPQLFVLYFILTRWDTARDSVINQILSADVMLAGYLVMRSVS